MAIDLQAIRVAVEAIARQAGATVMQYYDQPHHETIKANIYDVVTEGDKASEAVIVKALREQFSFPIHSEEGGGAGTDDPSAEYVWYVDPIDGTTNFANNIPFFSISIALADRHLSPVVGVVFNPVYQELFSAARGFGATFNGKPIHVTRTADLSRAVMSSGFPTDRHAIQNNNLPQWTAMLMAVRDLRRFGSAALDLAFVASGRLDGYWENRLNTWDCLAGILLVQEAGGQTTDWDGGTTNLYTGTQVVASNGLLHDRVLDVLNQA
ncbi:MAG TPA: inositol monophosphatase family protein [Phototrophicaceae bacterium]|nr:inositol monophosphatase family protein [Phototrophicaceae bacterium]